MKGGKSAAKYLSACLNKDTTFGTTNWTFPYYYLRFVALIKNKECLLMGIWEHKIQIGGIVRITRYFY